MPVQGGGAAVQPGAQGQGETAGSGHLDTLRLMQNLAIVYQCQCQYKELYEQALKGKEKQLGSQHPSALKTMQKLAETGIYLSRSGPVRGTAVVRADAQEQGKSRQGKGIRPVKAK